MIFLFVYFVKMKPYSLSSPLTAFETNVKGICEL